MQALVKQWPAPAAPSYTSAIKLDAPLSSLSVNRPVTIGFSVRPERADAYLPETLIVYAQHMDETSSRDVFTAKRDGARDHYKVTLELKHAGTCYWLINAKTAAGEQPMPMLSVLDATGKAGGGQANADATSPLLIAWGLMGLLGIVGALFTRLSARR